ncbi:hypothetical protein [Paenibacillus sp. YN15]|uniref:hypothetical protein n=1 Tax=Paenibacillus sp. YN15 TaxID=1742774 RepID=UPI0015EB6118|nr:hypothetical protein [Paenibacillus sp. YN15]
MRYLTVLGLAVWLAAFFPRKNSYYGQPSPGVREKTAYVVLSLAAASLCALQQWKAFPAIARFMDQGMMLIYRIAGGGAS